MEARRQRTFVLGSLVAVLAMVLWWQFGRPPSGRGRVPAASQTATSASAAPGQVAIAVPQVLIARLQQARSEPGDPGRDLFKFATRTGPSDRGAGTARPAAPGGVGAPSPAGPAGQAEAAAPPPPIALRFIGLVQKQGDPAKIAVLSDSRGVYHGREGDIIEGRYRIVRIGTESVELVYLDGRGRQVIRLSGA